MKTLLFIYNPAAGKAKITSALGEVTALFQKEDWLVTLYATKAAGRRRERRPRAGRLL